MSLPHAVILAGGRGERLGGVRKAAIRIGGVPLIERVAAALNGVAAPLLVATGHGQHGVLPEGAIALADLDERTGGPLAGLAAAVDWLARNGVRSGRLICVAVDTPFLPSNYVDVMESGLGKANAAYARWGEAFYPTNAIWQLTALADLPETLSARTGPRSLRALLEALGGVPCDWRGTHEADPFANLNTLADLVLLGRRAKGS